MENHRSPKRILVLNGHPAETSLNGALAEAYATAASDAGHQVRSRALHDMEFDPDYGFGGYTNRKPLEPALDDLMEQVEWAEHIVITTPMWWGGIPAKLKGLFDRALLPGRAFDTRNTTRIGLPKPMLTGRTARVMVTADTPRFLLRLWYRSAMLWQLGHQILNFIGIKPVRFSYFSGASHPKPGVIDRWLGKAAALGRAAA